ncbi:hypothetical protein ACWCPT_08420 [Streptomyces sp. NPDC002308]
MQGLVGSALVLVVGLGAAFCVIGSGQESRHGPPHQSTATSHEPEAGPSVSRAPAPPEADGGPTPATTVPLESSMPVYTPEPGNGSNTAEGRTHEARENGGYYDGNYDNDEEWHRRYGNPDEYYDGNYDNDDDYHRKYGTN